MGRVFQVSNFVKCERCFSELGAFIKLTKEMKRLNFFVPFLFSGFLSLSSTQNIDDSVMSNLLPDDYDKNSLKTAEGTVK